MLSGMFNLNNKKYYGQKSFTYFLPAPPERNTGYQEKEFEGKEFVSKNLRNWYCKGKK